MPLPKLTLSPRFLERPIAHRGLHHAQSGRIENSDGAFLAAIAAGYPIECDVQASRDDKAVVFHDPVLDRLTDSKGAVDDLTCAELEKITLVGGNDTISSLARILDLVAGQVPLVVEVKDQDGNLGANIGTFIDDIIDKVKNYADRYGEDAIAVMSFNPYVVAAIKPQLPRVAVGMVTDNFIKHGLWRDLSPERAKRLTQMAEIPALEFDFISHNFNYLDEIETVIGHNPDFPILCWTVKSKADEDIARRVADNITFEGYRP